MIVGARSGEEPFSYQIRKDGSVAVSHSGRVVSVIAGREGEKLAARLSGASVEDVQFALAKVTGNFKRGNERAAGNHARNK
ncbi:MAG: hypothetical protein JNM76_04025 [Betaproteobacteria bacterium]|nr:hypothetical protein [Betaproteobacteria bacterium]